MFKGPVEILIEFWHDDWNLGPQISELTQGRAIWLVNGWFSLIPSKRVSKIIRALAPIVSTWVAPQLLCQHGILHTGRRC